MQLQTLLNISNEGQLETWKQAKLGQLYKQLQRSTPFSEAVQSVFLLSS